jgi:PTH1 family peptidyl-tRNA hydrolase
MKVIVGLGNPGAQYTGTRHNVGFDVIDALAGAPGVGPFRSKFDAEVAEAREGGETVLFVKPTTFMNLSGRAVRAVLDFYKVPLADLLVVCDDFNLPLGKLRVRLGGSHGGQNGLRNIQQVLGTDGYPRLRIGVGAPRPGDAVDHVLGKWRPAERKDVDDAVSRAVQAVVTFVTQGPAACMNRFNAGPDDGMERAKGKKERLESPIRTPKSPRPKGDDSVPL